MADGGARGPDEVYPGLWGGGGGPCACDVPTTAAHAHCNTSGADMMHGIGGVESSQLQAKRGSGSSQERRPMYFLAPHMWLQVHTPMHVWVSTAEACGRHTGWGLHLCRGTALRFEIGFTWGNSELCGCVLCVCPLQVRIHKYGDHCKLFLWLTWALRTRIEVAGRAARKCNMQHDAGARLVLDYHLSTSAIEHGRSEAHVCSTSCTALQHSCKPMISNPGSQRSSPAATRGLMLVHSGGGAVLHMCGEKLRAHTHIWRRRC